MRLATLLSVATISLITFSITEPSVAVEQNLVTVPVTGALSTRPANAGVARTEHCFRVEGICYNRVKGFTGLVVRSDGAWGTDPFITEFLSSKNSDDQESANTLGGYRDLSVTNFAMNENQSFVAELHFTYGGSPQIVYVFGEIKLGNNGIYVGDLSRCVDLSSSQLQSRIQVKRLDNYFNAGSRNRMGELGQVGLEDMKRGEAVANLLAVWVTGRGSAVATKSTAISAADIH